MAAYIESAISWLLLNARGRDAAAFSTTPGFSADGGAAAATPTVTVTSPACGPSGATLGPAYMQGGEGLFPGLEWEDVEGVAEWLVFCEDVDAPFPTPLCHGFFLGIPKDKRAITHDDIQQDASAKNRVQGGFYYGKSLAGPIYMLPRPLLNHGPHRYFFTVVALKEPLDAAFVASRPSRAQLAVAVEGKVLAWGRWTGQCERKM
ncbi:phosphatidylethanolamine-binding protein [Stachybotrys elegans]|uniref:Phosphatidylethanolamine-binding protein n=1 Tax=Stachybotrys elegans TaxID=80388 RepID=A0A8K0WPJ2_9HYPO|nr:phosphatidylethanolamine-binding protein [Stachybotrys elegans]